MKTRLHQWLGRSAQSLAPPVVALTLLLAALPTRADTSFTNIGWFIARPLPGITVTNSSSHIYLKGNVHVVHFQSNDPRATGRMEAWMDLAYQPDGTAIFCGPAYFEVGTWDGTNFTATGGAWVLNYSGVLQADGSAQYSMAGYGIGGAIEGLRIRVTATRANQNPATPYLASGTIRPAPVNTSVVLDDFADGILKPQWVPWSSGTPYLTEAIDQLTVRGIWNRQATDPVVDHAGAYWPDNWSVPDGQTIEWRAEVLGMNQDAGLVGMGVGTGETRYYAFGLASNSVALYRWTATSGNTLLFSDPATVRQTNIVLCFALTRHQSQAVVTVRVEDRAAPGTVLYQRTYLDVTPFLSGNSVGLVVEPKPELHASDASAAFDNFTRRAYEVPSIGIEPAVRLTWPNPGMNCVIEAGPTPNGPWLPVQDCVPPGCQQMTVPQTGPMQFFRAVQAP